MVDYRREGKYLGYDYLGNTYREISGQVYRVNKFGQAMWFCTPAAYPLAVKVRNLQQA